MKTIDFKVKLTSELSSVKFCTNLVREASNFVSDITLNVGDKSVDLKSILGLMSLCLYDGREASISINGEDEVKAEDALRTTLSCF